MISYSCSEIGCKHTHAYPGSRIYPSPIDTLSKLSSFKFMGAHTSVTSALRTALALEARHFWTGNSEVPDTLTIVLNLEHRFQVGTYAWSRACLHMQSVIERWSPEQDPLKHITQRSSAACPGLRVALNRVVMSQLLTIRQVQYSRAAFSNMADTRSHWEASTNWTWVANVKCTPSFKAIVWKKQNILLIISLYYTLKYLKYSDKLYY